MHTSAAGAASLGEPSATASVYVQSICLNSVFTAFVGPDTQNLEMNIRMIRRQTTVVLHSNDAEYFLQVVFARHAPQKLQQSLNPYFPKKRRSSLSEFGIEP